MDEAVEKRACGQHHSARAHRLPGRGRDPNDSLVRDHKILDGRGPDGEDQGRGISVCESRCENAAGAGEIDRGA